VASINWPEMRTFPAALRTLPSSTLSDAEFAPDLLDIDGFALVSKTRIARDHEEKIEPRQRCGDFVHHAISEVILIGIGTQVGEGENGDRGFVGERKSGFRRFQAVVGDCRASRPLLPALVRRNGSPCAAMF
jgi:hypothetical protein